MKTFVKGEKAFVFLRPIKVTITKARPYWDEYYCRKCGKHINIDTLYGRSNDGRTFCLKCCKEV
jgi:hypothetical protein